MDAGIAGEGLFASLKNLTVTLVAIAHTRLDLLATDLEEERERMLSLLVMALVSLFCFGVGVVLLAILLVAAFWDTHRILVLGVLTGAFLLTGALVCGRAVHALRTGPRIFEASLSELIKDRQQIGSRR
jgi:uncharacterized membrane protein YqjE